jgi:hypothetical protein
VSLFVVDGLSTISTGKYIGYVVGSLWSTFSKMTSKFKKF